MKFLREISFFLPISPFFSAIKLDVTLESLALIPSTSPLNSYYLLQKYTKGCGWGSYFPLRGEKKVGFIPEIVWLPWMSSPVDVQGTHWRSPCKYIKTLLLFPILYFYKSLSKQLGTKRECPLLFLVNSPFSFPFRVEKERSEASLIPKHSCYTVNIGNKCCTAGHFKTKFCTPQCTRWKSSETILTTSTEVIECIQEKQLLAL